MKRYLVLTVRTSHFQQSAIEPHYAFLEALKQRGVLEMAGPFTDKTGGAYILKAADMDEARKIAKTDPVHTTGSSKVTVHEWEIRVAAAS